MTVEEVMIKVGVDTSQVAPELLKAKVQVQGVGEHAHKSFLHASNGAKEFKKALHEVTDQSGLLGVAIKAFLSPIGATFTAALLIFDTAKEKLAEWNKQMDEVGERNAKPLTKTREILEKVQEETEKNRKATEQWRKANLEISYSYTDALKEETDQLKTRYALVEQLIQQQVRMGLISGVRGHGLLYAAKLQEAKDARDAAFGAVGTVYERKTEAEAAFNQSDSARNNESRKVQLEHAREQRSSSEANKERLKKEWDVAIDELTKRRNSPILKAEGKTPEEIDKFLKVFVDREVFAKQAYFANELQMDRSTDAVKRLTREQDDSEEAFSAAKKELEHLTKQFGEASKEAVKAKERLEQIKGERPLGARGLAGLYGSDADMPSLQQVARSGTWWNRNNNGGAFFQSGPFAGIASEYLGLGEQAAGARAFGNVGAYNRIEQRKGYLGSILRDAGLMPYEYEKSIDASLTAMLAKLQGVLTVQGTDDK